MTFQGMEGALDRALSEFRVSTGDEKQAALRVVVELLWQSLMRRSVPVHVGKEDFEDAVQESMLRMLRYGQLQRFARGEDVLRYAFVVLRRTLFQILAKKRETDGDLAGDGHNHLTVYAQVSDWDSQLGELLGVVRDFSPVDQKILLLVAEGYTYADLTIAVGLKPQVLRKRLERLRKRLKERLSVG